MFSSIFPFMHVTNVLQVLCPNQATQVRSIGAEAVFECSKFLFTRCSAHLALMICWCYLVLLPPNCSLAIRQTRPQDVGARKDSLGCSYSPNESPQGLDHSQMKRLGAWKPSLPRLSLPGSWPTKHLSPCMLPFWGGLTFNWVKGCLGTLSGVLSSQGPKRPTLVNLRGVDHCVLITPG